MLPARRHTETHIPTPEQRSIAFCARVAKQANGGGLKTRSRRGPWVQIPTLACRREHIVSGDCALGFEREKSQPGRERTRTSRNVFALFKSQPSRAKVKRTFRRAGARRYNRFIRSGGSRQRSMSDRNTANRDTARGHGSRRIERRPLSPSDRCWPRARSPCSPGAACSSSSSLAGSPWMRCRCICCSWLSCSGS